jgi:hypothetical protein
VIFPYDVADGEATEILWPEFKRRFPKTGEYLEQKKRALMKAVEGEKGTNRWHLYKYPKNLVGQTVPKVFFPMTIEDTMASVDVEGDVYQDNVNVNSISFAGVSSAQLAAIAAVFNSTLFNALARLKAGLNDSGWRKFNRQYAELVPFPKEIFTDKIIVKRLSTLAGQISKIQNKSVRVTGEGAKASLRSTLESLWAKLDEDVESIYGLSKSQKEVLKKYPRRVNRFDLLSRQTDINEEDE